MKYLIILAAAIMSFGCANMKVARPNKITARITYYTCHEDKYGSRVACSPKVRAKEGVTVAAHPDFPFWTQIRIPWFKSVFGDDEFIIQDRGRAVTRKKAAAGKSYVFDVYLNGSNKKMRQFAKRAPSYMEVIVPNKG